ncbi:hypothetical protein B0H19DRAFT_1374650 [Mycena capillaripes]|nr:hypothetical protein B0H19DRAFT_1374650 [Mycena capillaripes]
MHLEAYSFWGQVVNLYNTALAAGGSSGKCSALIAFGGFPLSIDSDIGGSLRSPAACRTNDILPSQKGNNGFSAQHGIPSLRHLDPCVAASATWIYHPPAWHGSNVLPQPP